MGVDFKALQAAAAADAAATADDSDVAEDVALIPALPSPAQAKLASYDPAEWAGVNANLEDMVVVVGIGEVGQAVGAWLGAKRKVVHIAAQGAGDLHVVSNPFNNRRAAA